MTDETAVNLDWTYGVADLGEADGWGLRVQLGPGRYLGVIVTNSRLSPPCRAAARQTIRLHLASETCVTLR